MFILLNELVYETYLIKFITHKFYFTLYIKFTKLFQLVLTCFEQVFYKKWIFYSLFIYKILHLLSNLTTILLCNIWIHFGNWFLRINLFIYSNFLSVLHQAQNVIRQIKNVSKIYIQLYIVLLSVVLVKDRLFTQFFVFVCLNRINILIVNTSFHQI